MSITFDKRHCLWTVSGQKTLAYQMMMMVCCKRKKTRSFFRHAPLSRTGVLLFWAIVAAPHVVVCPYHKHLLCMPIFLRGAASAEARGKHREPMHALGIVAHLPFNGQVNISSRCVLRKNSYRTTILFRETGITRTTSW